MWRQRESLKNQKLNLDQCDYMWLGGDSDGRRASSFKKSELRKQKKTSDLVTLDKQRFPPPKPRKTMSSASVPTASRTGRPHVVIRLSRNRPRPLQEEPSGSTTAVFFFLFVFFWGGVWFGLPPTPPLHFLTAKSHRDVISQPDRSP